MAPAAGVRAGATVGTGTGSACEQLSSRSAVEFVGGKQRLPDIARKYHLKVWHRLHCVSSISTVLYLTSDVNHLKKVSPITLIICPCSPSTERGCATRPMECAVSERNSAASRLKSRSGTFLYVLYRIIYHLYYY